MKDKAITLKIYWALESSAAHPALTHGLPPAGLLDGVEMETFLRFKVDKRRREWLLGRWTAKRLLHSVLGLNDEASASGRHQMMAGARYDQIPIRNDAVGRPYTPAAPVTLSLSHSGRRAAAAVVRAVDWPLGIDLEQIAPRPATFEADYLTPAELAQLDEAPAGRRDQWLTIIWSGKEAALKALGLGLSVDTRAVTIGIAPGPEDPAGTGWHPLTVTCHADRLPRPAPALTGWWRIIESDILTIVCSHGSSLP